MAEQKYHRSKIKQVFDHCPNGQQLFPVKRGCPLQPVRTNHQRTNFNGGNFFNFFNLSSRIVNTKQI